MDCGIKLPLKELRENLKPKLSQSEIATRIGCTPKTYRSWEQGARPNTADLISLSKIFGVSTDYILGLSDYKHVEYRDVSTITGLSEAAISTIIDNHFADIVSLIVTQPEFLKIVDLLRKLSDHLGVSHTNMRTHVNGIWERGFNGGAYYSVDVRAALKYQADTLFRYILDHISEGDKDNG